MAFGPPNFDNGRGIFPHGTLTNIGLFFAAHIRRVGTIDIYIYVSWNDTIFNS